MEQERNRTWADISLGALEHNFREIKKTVGEAKVLCILKANAYGHGAIQAANLFKSAGADYFGVATVQEALDLRRANIDLPILILGYVDAQDAELVARNDITASVYDRQSAQMLSKAAQQAGQDIKIHIKADTGMTRLGFSSSDKEGILYAAGLPGLDAEGIFTHFAVSDEISEKSKEYTLMQLEQFQKLCSDLEKKGLKFPLKHCANSGAVLQYTCSYFNMVRAGIVLYGYYPDGSLEKTLKLEPAMTLKAHVVQVREVEENTYISYGCTYKTPSKRRIAVVSIGYADGYLRAGSGKAELLICGKKAPVVGRICMDMCMADVTDIPEVRQGDEVFVFGPGPVNAAVLARAAGTIPYEILCAVSQRVPRIYYK